MCIRDSCQAVRVIGGLRLITVNEIQLPAWRNILEHRSSEANPVNGATAENNTYEYEFIYNFVVEQK